MILREDRYNDTPYFRHKEKRAVALIQRLITSYIPPRRVPMRLMRPANLIPVDGLLPPLFPPCPMSKPRHTAVGGVPR